MTTAQLTNVTDFDAFYQANYADLVSMVYAFTGDLAASQDIAQESFTRAWQRWKSVCGYESPVAWVRRVATNLAYSRWRRIKVAAAYLARQRDEALTELVTDSRDVVEALKRLPAGQRKAIVLHYLLDLPIEDVAAELQAPLGTVKSWLHRGKGSLARELADDVRGRIKPGDSAAARARGDERRRRNRVAAAAASASAVILIVLAAWVLPGRIGLPADQSPTPSEAVHVVIPAGIIGANREQAQQMLGAVNLRPDFVDEDGPAPAGVASQTLPPAGQNVLANSTVQIRLSKGNMKPVPFVVGLQEADAKTLLEAAGFKVAVIGDEKLPAGNPNIGKVAVQDPLRDTIVPADRTTITLFVNRPGP